MSIHVFLDSDVVISSLISTKGAAHLLIHQVEDISFHVSDLSVRELEIVVSRLRLDVKKLKHTITSRCDTVKLANKKQIQNNYTKYVLDVHDAHIIAGAKESASRFLITYNSKHFHAEKIKDDLGILQMTPGQFLQYVRSLS